MANSLTRFDPLSELARMDPFRGLDEFFNQSMMGPRMRSTGMSPRMGQFYRSFTLPQAVDDSQAKAEYHDGILELTLPKRTGGTAKKLPIH